MLALEAVGFFIDFLAEKLIFILKFLFLENKFQIFVQDLDPVSRILL